MVQTLDNLRRDGVLSVIDYLERMPDKLITRKQELVESLKQRAAAAENTSSTAGAVPLPHEGKAYKEGGGFAMASELDAAKKIAQLPTGMQAKYSSLPRTAQRALIK